MAGAASLESGTDLSRQALGLDTTSVKGSTGEPSGWCPQQPEKMVGSGGHRNSLTSLGWLFNNLESRAIIIKRTDIPTLKFSALEGLHKMHT
jgi:hypothetical protein